MGGCSQISRISSRLRVVIPLSSPAALSSLLGIRSFTSQISPQEGEDGPSFPVSYLMSSLGFSLDRANASSRFMNFQTAEKPDAVVNLLRGHGFSSTQIAKCIKRSARLLLLDPEKILAPKFDFLRSIGISGPELAELVSTNPQFLIMSLEKRLIPRYNLLKEVLGDETRVVDVLKRSHRSFFFSDDTNIVPNIALLRKIGVGENYITYLLSQFPNVAFQPHSEFAESVERAEQFGFNPWMANFVVAVRTFSTVKKSTWEKKLEVYGRWGWSKDLTLSAFKRYPQCMCASEEKIMQVMDFLVNKLGWESEAAARSPTIFALSFEKRIVPRCMVLQLLWLKGLIDYIPWLAGFLYPGEDRFKEKYVAIYEDDIKAQLLDVYERRVNVMDFRTMAVEDVKARS